MLKGIYVVMILVGLLLPLVAVSPLEPWFDQTWRPGEIELVSDDDL